MQTDVSTVTWLFCSIRLCFGCILAAVPKIVSTRSEIWWCAFGGTSAIRRLCCVNVTIRMPIPILGMISVLIIITNV